MVKGKRRAAIITPYGLWNYGNRLQNYAVSQILAERGFEPTTLVMKNNWAAGVAEDAKLFIGHQILHAKGAVSDKYKAFRAFDRSMRKMYVGPRYNLEKLNRKFDLFVIGSDQIWNPHQVSLHGCEFAKGVDPEKVICISPSFGIDALPIDNRDYYLQGLSRLRHISVREESGAEIIRSLLGVEVPVMADPTILVGKSVWDTVPSTISIPNNQYAVTYFLGSNIAHNDSAVSSITQEQGLDVISLLDKRNTRYYSAAPNDFVKLIASSEAVLTDSFHAALFSLMYGKQLFLFPREGKVDMSSRFATVKALFNVEFSAESVCGLQIKQAVYDYDSFNEAALFQTSRFQSFFNAAVEEASCK